MVGLVTQNFNFTFEVTDIAIAHITNMLSMPSGSSSQIIKQ